MGPGPYCMGVKVCECVCVREKETDAQSARECVMDLIYSMPWCYLPLYSFVHLKFVCNFQRLRGEQNNSIFAVYSDLQTPTCAVIMQLGFIFCWLLSNSLSLFWENTSSSGLLRENNWAKAKKKHVSPPHTPSTLSHSTLHSLCKTQITN